MAEASKPPTCHCSHAGTIRANKETIFIVLSLLLAFVDGIKHLILDTIWASRKITCQNDLNDQRLDYTFPGTLFSVSGGQELSRKEVFNSLGEYLLQKIEKCCCCWGLLHQSQLLMSWEQISRTWGPTHSHRYPFDPTNFINKIVSVSSLQRECLSSWWCWTASMLRMNFRAALLGFMRWIGAKSKIENIL